MSKVIMLNAKVSLIVRSYVTDFEWLELSVQSMRKFLTGLDERILITPCGHIPSKQILSYFDKHVQTVEACDGYIAQQIDKMYAFNHTDNEFLLFSDSDCMYTQSWDVRSRIVDGKCLLHRSEWSQIPDWAWYWRDVVERHTGIRPAWEYMRGQPLMHSAETVRSMLEHFPGLIKSAMKVRNREFSEFNCIGTFAQYVMPERYIFSDDAPDRPCKQYWSYGGLTQEIHAEIEEMFSTPLHLRTTS